MATRRRDSPPRVTAFKLNGQTIDLGAYLRAEYDDVGHASKELPELLGFIGECLQEVRQRAGSLRIDLKVRRARAYFELVGEGEGGGAFAENYTCKATAAAIGYAVDEDAEVVRIGRDINDAETWAMRLEDIRDEIKAKIELTRSTESTRRAAFEAAEKP